MNLLEAVFLSIWEENAKEIQSQLAWMEVKTEWKRTFRVVASSEDVDRAGEVIKADGWDYENFMKNPVIIANHIYKIENIVGKATNIQVKDNKLLIEWVFSEVNPLWKLLADLYDEWMVKTVSVGFIPKQRQEDNRRIITSAELLELSFVAVPCNPNALSLDQKELLQKGIEAWILLKDESEDDNKEENQDENKEDEVIEGEEKPESESEDESKSLNKKAYDDIMGELADIKSLLQTIVDGNTKATNDANIIAKETMQEVARTVNAWLAAFKKAL